LTEIMLPSDEEYNFVCVLSSLNLLHWDRLKDSDDIFWATVFLACINKEFIMQAKGVPGMERSVKAAEDFAAVGLGVLGWHSLLQDKLIPFSSFEAHMLNNQIFKRIEEESERANRWLAEVFGETKYTKGLGVHCAAVRAIAPTKSTAALIGGLSEGINPDPSMIFTQATPSGEVNRINPFLLRIMKARGAYNQAEVDRIAANGGSVQDCSWLTANEKKVFLTAFEINMLDHLRLCEARQKYIDQGQSINLFFTGDAKPSWINTVHKYAFLSPWIKSLYYIYSTRLISGVNKECEACS
jgi:ribonucleoside-diphosphate reductase alpha chain